MRKMKHILLENESNILDHLDIIQYEQHSHLRKSLHEIKHVIDLAMHEGEPSMSLVKCREIFLELNEEIEVHFKEEEDVLFPLIRKMEKENCCTNSEGNTLEAMVHVLEYENNHSGAALEKLKDACLQYSECRKSFEHYNKLMELLRDFESDLRAHANNETVYLYPAAIRKEKILRFLPSNSPIRDS